MRSDPPEPKGKLDTVLAEQHAEWAEQRRYLGLDVLTRSRAALTMTDPEEANHLAIPSALSA